MRADEQRTTSVPQRDEFLGREQEGKIVAERTTRDSFKNSYLFWRPGKFYQKTAKYFIVLIHHFEVHKLSHHLVANTAHSERKPHQSQNSKEQPQSPVMIFYINPSRQHRLQSEETQRGSDELKSPSEIFSG